MKKIETYEQLQEEKRASRQKIALLEMQIREDVAEIKESLKPMRLAGQAARSLFTSERKNNVVGESIDLTVDALIKKLLFRKAGWAIKLAATFFLKNYAKNVVAKRGDSIVHWIVSKIQNRKTAKEYYHNDKSTTANHDWDA